MAVAVIQQQQQQQGLWLQLPRHGHGGQEEVEAVAQQRGLQLWPPQASRPPRPVCRSRGMGWGQGAMVAQTQHQPPSFPGQLCPAKGLVACWRWQPGFRALPWVRWRSCRRSSRIHPLQERLCSSQALHS